MEKTLCGVYTTLHLAPPLPFFVERERESQKKDKERKGGGEQTERCRIKTMRERERMILNQEF